MNAIHAGGRNWTPSPRRDQGDDMSITPTCRHHVIPDDCGCPECREIGRLRAENARLRLDSERYETARTMTPQQWAAAWEFNLKTGKPFDEIIDDLGPFQRAMMEET